MLMKALKYGVVGLLMIALVGGSIYILARPADAEARGEAREQALSASQGRGRAQGEGVSYREGTGYRGGGEGLTCQECEGNLVASQRRMQGEVATSGAGTGYQGGAGSGGQGRNDSGRQPGEGAPAATETHVWETLQGVVVAIDHELTVATQEGEVVVGMGQAAYIEGLEFDVSEGDEVVVRGFYEDGEFKAGEVENLTTGDSISLRDPTGRPVWAGRGNGQNRRP